MGSDGGAGAGGGGGGGGCTPAGAHMQLDHARYHLEQHACDNEAALSAETSARGEILAATNARGAFRDPFKSPSRIRAVNMSALNRWNKLTECNSKV